MTEILTPPSCPGFKDRKVGLVVFGIFTILAGAFCALFVPLMIFAPKAAGGTTNFPALFLGAGLYGTLAVALIWLGIGSVLAKRWARALLLIVSWGVLIMGVFAIGFMAFMAPNFLTNIQANLPAGQPKLPGAVETGMLVFMFGFLGIFFLVLPGIWVFFYGRKSVKATCEARDPVVRWTDRCPLPVLALSLMLAFGGLMMAVSIVSMNGVFPLFGMLLHGPAGIVAGMLVAVFWLYLARAVYRLSTGSWLLTFLTMAVFSISGFITYSRHSMMEFYQLAGYSPEMMEQIRRSNVFQGNSMAWITLASCLPWLIYLLFLRRFFRPPATPPPLP